MSNKRTRNGPAVLKYHAAYYPIEDGWFMARVLDFPGTVTQGKTLKSARRMARDALRLMAQCTVERGAPLPLPQPGIADKKAIFSEVISLRIRALAGAVS